MSDPRFFTKKEGMTLGDLCHHLGARALDSTDLSLKIQDVCFIESPENFCLSFVKSKKHLPQIFEHPDMMFLVAEDLSKELPATLQNVLFTENFDEDLARSIQYLYPRPFLKTSEPKASAISESAKIGENVTLSPGVVIGDYAEIGDGTFLGPNVVIGPGVVVGRNAEINAGAALQCALVGDNVVIHQNASIGQAGFGFAIGKKGFLDIPQVGRVIIEDNVHIGAGCAIDRGGLKDTLIKAFSRLDNLIQIGHNVEVGRACVLVAQVGIGGSSIIGDYSILGGQVGIADHVTIGKNVKLASKSGVMRNIEDNAVMGGIPCVPIRQWHRTSLVLNKLTKKEEKT
jgi:UDP-3-O-[3-hydroxymyristoyl] glucosamine N-acyltransferase